MKKKRNLDIKSVHNVDGKKVIVLKEEETPFKPWRPKLKAKSYYTKLKNSK